MPDQKRPPISRSSFAVATTGAAGKPDHNHRLILSRNQLRVQPGQEADSHQPVGRKLSDLMKRRWAREKASRQISWCGVMKQFAVNGEFGRVDCCAPKFLQYGHRKGCSDFGIGCGANHARNPVTRAKYPNRARGEQCLGHRRSARMARPCRKDQ